MAYRCLYNAVVQNMVILYPPHKGNAADQGIEIMIPFETHEIDMIMTDPSIKEFFEFRGIEVRG